MFAVPRAHVARIHASSGTTGKPTVVGYTRDDIDMWASVMARSIRAAGGRAGHILHNAYGYGLFTGGLGAHYGGERLGCTVIPVSGGMTERQVQLIEDFRPDLIMATPSYMLTVIDEMERQGIDPRFTSLKVGIFGAETWTNDMRREMEARLDMHAVDIYGLSEVIGPGVANECVETKDGLHVWEDHFYLSPHFQCVLDRTGNLDSLTVVVEQREGVALDRAENAGTLLRRLVKNSIGVSIGVRVVNLGTVERSVGKMRRIVDHRPAR